MARLALIFLNTVILLALAEGAARIAEWVHPAADAVTFGYAPYRMLKMTKAPWTLNREGFRAREFEIYRHTFLVEFLGGSACLGVGTNPGEPLPERLEDALHRAGLEHATVLNLCQGGATSAQELAIFLEFGLPLQPRVVLSFDGANDLMHPRPLGGDDAPNLPYRNAEMQSRVDGDLALAEHLALIRVGARLRRRAVAEPGRAGAAVPLDEILQSYLYTLQVTRTLTEAQGGFHAVLLQPTLHFEKPWSGDEKNMWREQYPRDGDQISRSAHEMYATARTLIRRWSLERGETLVDLTEVFAGTPETIYSDSVHFSGERGYAMLAVELERQGLVERIAKQYRDWEKRNEAVSRRMLKKGTDYSVPSRKLPTSCSTVGVDRAVCPLFQKDPGKKPVSDELVSRQSVFREPVSEDKQAWPHRQ